MEALLTLAMKPLKLLVKPPDIIKAANKTYKCSIGKGGVSTNKKEGDGCSPTGTFPLSLVLYRQDRLPPPKTSLPFLPIKKNHGWCDDPCHKDYNTLITTPHDGTFEHLWRQDQIYDIMVVIDYNVDPVVPYRGSAIFLHLTSRKTLPTEGCVALKTEAMLEILSKAKPGTVIEISENL